MNASRKLELLSIKSAMREYYWQKHYQALDAELGSSISRYSIAKVRDTISSLSVYPELRHRFLWIMVRGIQEASLYGAEKWTILLKPDWVRLVVASADVCTLVRNSIWLGLEIDDSYFDHPHDGWTPDRNPYHSFDIKAGYYNPAFGALWSQIQDGLFQFIQRAAETREIVQASHQPTQSREVLAFLREEFPQYIPDSAY